MDERGSTDEGGWFASGIVLKIIDDKFPGFHFLRHHVGGAAGTHANANAARRGGRVNVVEGKVPNGSTGGCVHVDSGVVFVMLQRQCHGFSGPGKRGGESKSSSSCPYSCSPSLSLSFSLSNTLPMENEMQ